MAFPPVLVHESSQSPTTSQRMTGWLSDSDLSIQRPAAIEAARLRRQHRRISQPRYQQPPEEYHDKTSSSGSEDYTEEVEEIDRVKRKKYSNEIIDMKSKKEGNQRVGSYRDSADCDEQMVAKVAAVSNLRRQGRNSSSSTTTDPSDNNRLNNYSWRGQKETAFTEKEPVTTVPQAKVQLSAPREVNTTGKKESYNSYQNNPLPTQIPLPQPTPPPPLQQQPPPLQQQPQKQPPPQQKQQPMQQKQKQIQQQQQQQQQQQKLRKQEQKQQFVPQTQPSSVPLKQSSQTQKQPPSSMQNQPSPVQKQPPQAIQKQQSQPPQKQLAQKQPQQATQKQSLQQKQTLQPLQQPSTQLKPSPAPQTDQTILRRPKQYQPTVHFQPEVVRRDNRAQLASILNRSPSKTPPLPPHATAVTPTVTKSNVNVPLNNKIT